MIAGVTWPTTVTRNIGVGPCCVVVAPNCWLGLGGVCAIALPVTRLAITNEIVMARLRMEV